jgi:hypothetical protein
VFHDNLYYFGLKVLTFGPLNDFIEDQNAQVAESKLQKVVHQLLPDEVKSLPLHNEDHLLHHIVPVDVKGQLYDVSLDALEDQLLFFLRFHGLYQSLERQVSNVAARDTQEVFRQLLQDPKSLVGGRILHQLLAEVVSKFIFEEEREVIFNFFDDEIHSFWLGCGHILLHYERFLSRL